MKIVFFSAQPYDKTFFTKYNTQGFELSFIETALNEQTVALAEGAEAVCVFVNDRVNADIISKLAAFKVQIIALRCAGFNNVDLEAAKNHGLRVCRVPAYSPEAVAEHAVAMILTLNRKTHKAYNRVREQNFSLQGLLGYNLHGKTIGIVGTGNIGKAFASIMLGFGCKVVAFDLIANKGLEEMGVVYLPLMEVLKADIVSLHCPLNEQTFHIINVQTLGMMQDGAVLINTSRGGLVDTQAVINALKTGKISALGIDVYEQEEKLFFKDHSSDIIEDDTIQRLMSFPNVLITAHQAFFTDEALMQIATTTMKSIDNLLNRKEVDLKGAVLG